jgi:selenocysteine lyase/cysteine desulfurase
LLTPGITIAAYLPTGALDFSIVQPEFMIMSFYKLFGYPTGVGCLVAKRSALTRLHRPWFSGGTIRAVTIAVQGHDMGFNECAFEDGTLNFLSIPDIIFGLDWIASIGLHVISLRVRCLTAWFLDRLSRLEHSNGNPMVILYGPSDTKERGGTITFNFLDIAGKIVDERLVAAESALARISLRTGCFCNPGAAENAFGLSASNLRGMSHAKGAPPDELLQIKGMSTGGAIRVSFGLVSNVSDMNRFFVWAERTYQNRLTSNAGLSPREGC